MRKVLLLALLGLVGCGSVQNLREARDDESGGKRCALCRVTRPADGGHVQVRVAQPIPLESVPIEEKPAVLSAQVTEPARELPEGPAVTELKPNLPVVERKIDEGAALAEEIAIVRREATALANKGETTAIIEVPSAPIQRGAEPRIVSENAVKPVNEPMVLKTETVAESTTESAPEKEKSAAIKSVHIQFGQTDNFKTITGQVQQFRKTLRLRYAAIDQEDPYGGSVVLDGGAELSQVREGQHVRVRGELIPPADRNGSARYRVTAVEILD
jgi:hypothetical protein